MSGIELTWQAGPGGPPLDASPLLPEALATLSVADLARLPLQHGNRKVELGELFTARRAGRAGTLTLLGATDRFDRLGRAMRGGGLRVEGDAGHFLAQDMVAGTIEVTGVAGRYAATGMVDGEVRIGGDAGGFAGAALPGGRFGMRGGVMLVDGSLGDRAGDRMRRGVIVAGGDAGAFLGARMIGGTISVKGTAGSNAGFAMRRGTLLLDRAPAHLMATFADGGAHDLPWLRLLFRQMEAWGVHGAGRSVRRQRLTGCASSDGKGELLLAVT